MKSIILMGLFVLFISSCGDNVISEKVVENDVLVDSIIKENDVQTINKPSNVVTPEHWENFDTDIEMTILFYKGDSLDGGERKIVDGLKEEFSSLEFHEFYSDDNIAQVFLNDTLVFDISYYLQAKTNGFVLLKPSVQPIYKSLNHSLGELKDEFHEFYGNK